jgi:hypothetical protein
MTSRSHWLRQLAPLTLVLCALTVAHADAQPPEVPGTPSQLQAAVVGLEVTLTWNPPPDAASVTSYVVEAGSVPGAADLAQLNTGSTATSMTVSAPPGTYYVRVRGWLGGFVGAASNEVVVTVSPGCASPPAPTGLNHTLSGSTVDLSWQTVAVAATYVVEAGSGPGLSNLASIASGSLSSLTATAPPGTYYVRVRARNACGTSSASNEIVIVVGGCSVPTTPAGLTASVNGSAVTLNWQPAGGTDTGYRVEVGSTPGANNLAQFEPGNVTGLTATAPNGTYHARVRAVSGCGAGPASNEIVVSVLTAPTSDWLLRVNTWRQRAGVATVVEEPAWSLGATLHSRYAVKDNRNPYDRELSSSPWYTSEGDAIAHNSVAYWSRDVSDSDALAIDAFIPGDWHEAVGLLDHRLRRVGFGSFREVDPGGFLAMAAVLDVKRGLDGPATLAAPVVFPAPGAVIPGSDEWCLDGAACSVHPYPGEFEVCSFYEFDMSVPIIMQFGTAAPPTLTAASVTTDGVSIPVCAFTADTYKHERATRVAAIKKSLGENRRRRDLRAFRVGARTQLHRVSHGQRTALSMDVSGAIE